MKTVDVAWPARIVAKQETILRPTDFISTKPTNSVASDSTDFGRWKQRIRLHINARKPDLERWMIGVAWKGGCEQECAAQRWHESTSSSTALFAAARLRPSFNPMCGFYPYVAQLLPTNPSPLQSYLSASFTWLQSRVSSLSKLNSSCANF